MAYNTTDLDPESTFERHVFHRDQFAHFLRWTYVLKSIGRELDKVVVDFGCGKGNLLEVLYRNRHQVQRYIGLDIRKATIKKANEKYQNVDWAEFMPVDLVLDGDFIAEQDFLADYVCSFEVLEHVGKNNAHTFIQNFKACGHTDSTWLLSTPNFDPYVGAAGNHTYDSGDGRGIAVQEFTFDETKELLSQYFNIEAVYGTFASQKDYINKMTPAQHEVYTDLKRYYDSNLMAVLMAPIIEPKLARNCIWVLKYKEDEDSLL